MEKFQETLSEGQVIITLPFGYNLNVNSLFVSLNGQVLLVNKDYSELSVNRILLSEPAKSGELLEARKLF